MKKKAVAAILAAAMVVSMTACGGNTNSSQADSESNAGSASVTESTTDASGSAADDGSASATADGDKKDIKIGMAWAILDDGQTNLTNGIKACLDNNYPDYNIEYTLTNADSDIATLISDVESQIAKNPDVIYIMNSVGDAGIIPAIEACKAAGIPVGIGVSLDQEAPYTYLYEGFSNYACGQMQAEYMDSIFDESTEYKVALITGDAGNVAGQDRTNGFVENFIDKHDNATEVIRGEGNWNTDDSQSLAEDWLISHPEINVIVCVNDDEAQGVINACQAADRSDVIILGIDASDVGKSNVESGLQAATVGIDFAGVASACADAMIKAATGEIQGEGNEVKYTTENLYTVTRE